jgi:vanillate/4-hydroxybenzoate decarboxylase subunit D
VTTCPRCETEQSYALVESPVKGCWVVYLCPVCYFVWRSTEPAEVTDPQLYNPDFKVRPSEIPRFREVPPVARKKV